MLENTSLTVPISTVICVSTHPSTFRLLLIVSRFPNIKIGPIFSSNDKKSGKTVLHDEFVKYVKLKQLKYKSILHNKSIVLYIYKQYT